VIRSSAHALGADRARAPSPHTERVPVSAMSTSLFQGPFGGQGSRMEEPVTELSLLLPTWLAAEMERLARSRGMTLGQLIRLLIWEHLGSRGGAGGRGDAKSLYPTDAPGDALRFRGSCLRDGPDSSKGGER
jgi:hypothetical protein